LAYTVCQVPVVHKEGTGHPCIEVTMTNGRTERMDGLVLDRGLSNKIFRRSHEVAQLTVMA
jgi:hypothetical protein